MSNCRQRLVLQLYSQNPTTNQQKPEDDSLNGVTAFNKTEISPFFERLEDVMAK